MIKNFQPLDLNSYNRHGIVQNPIHQSEILCVIYFQFLISNETLLLCMSNQECLSVPATTTGKMGAKNVPFLCELFSSN